MVKFLEKSRVDLDNLLEPHGDSRGKGDGAIKNYVVVDRPEGYKRQYNMFNVKLKKY